MHQLAAQPVTLETLHGDASEKQSGPSLEDDRHRIALPDALHFDASVQSSREEAAQALTDVLDFQGMAGLEGQLGGKRLEPETIHALELHRLYVQAFPCTKTVGSGLGNGGRRRRGVGRLSRHGRSGLLRLRVHGLGVHGHGSARRDPKRRKENDRRTASITRCSMAPCSRKNQSAPRPCALDRSFGASVNPYRLQAVGCGQERDASGCRDGRRSTVTPILKTHSKD